MGVRLRYWIRRPGGASFTVNLQPGKYTVAVQGTRKARFQITLSTVVNTPTPTPTPTPRGITIDQFANALASAINQANIKFAEDAATSEAKWPTAPGPPRHFFLSFLRFSIVTNYCTCRLYLFVMTKATANIVKRCDDVPQKLRFSPNTGFAIRPSSPILMRWPCQPPYPAPSTRNW